MVGLTVAAVLAVAVVRQAHLELLILAAGAGAALALALALAGQALPLFDILIRLLRQPRLQGHLQLR